jgi:hypothetical protein
MNNTAQVLDVEEYELNDKAGAYDAFKEHGQPYDRGAADAWYDRNPEPHYYPKGSHNGERVKEEQMTADQIDAYNAGYYIHNADLSYRKCWD